MASSTTHRTTRRDPPNLSVFLCYQCGDMFTSKLRYDEHILVHQAVSLCHQLYEYETKGLPFENERKRQSISAEKELVKSRKDNVTSSSFVDRRRDTSRPSATSINSHRRNTVAATSTRKRSFDVAPKRKMTDPLPDSLVCLSKKKCSSKLKIKLLKSNITTNVIDQSSNKQHSQTKLAETDTNLASPSSTSSKKIVNETVKSETERSETFPNKSSESPSEISGTLVANSGSAKSPSQIVNKLSDGTRQLERPSESVVSSKATLPKSSPNTSEPTKDIESQPSTSKELILGESIVNPKENSSKTPKSVATNESDKNKTPHGSQSNSLPSTKDPKGGVVDTLKKISSESLQNQRSFSPVVSGQKCLLCEYRSNQGWEMVEHNVRVHNVSISVVEKTAFVDGEWTAKEMLTAEEQCNFCSRSFSETSEYYLHIITSHRNGLFTTNAKRLNCVVHMAHPDIPVQRINITMRRP